MGKHFSSDPRKCPVGQQKHVNRKNIFSVLESPNCLNDTQQDEKKYLK